MNLTTIAAGVSVTAVLAGMATASVARGVGEARRDGPAPIRTLLLTGVNNHNWRYTSRLHAETLRATGRFDVRIIDEPGRMLGEAGAVDGVGLFVVDYNDLGTPARWGTAAEGAFVEAVRNGAGVVLIHSANNAFAGWEEWERMAGLVWREGAGHGPVHAFDVAWEDPGHAVTRGLGPWVGHEDELYHGLSNPAKAEYRLLASAMSETSRGGSGTREPVAIAGALGKGRIFATALGHVWEGRGETKASVSDPAFKTLLSRGAEWAATGEVTLGATWSDAREHNRLSEGERAAGWTLLFDGERTVMRKFRGDEFPSDGWTIEGGTIRHLSGKGGGDLVTPEEYADFEFECEWRAAPGANSGIIYRCTEDRNYSWETGPEMQILDDARHADGKNELTRAGTLYALFATAYDVARPAGEWNHARVVVRGRRIEHWLNGFKVVDVDLDGEAYAKAHAASKFTKMPEFATRARGRVALQDHGDDVWFRNIKVRALK